VWGSPIIWGSRFGLTKSENLISRLAHVRHFSTLLSTQFKGAVTLIFFAGEHYLFAYVFWLKAFPAEFSVDVHVWVLMTKFEI
jgi:hypothetical protein